MSRKMATIRVIDAIDSIEGADQIELAVVGGWKVVVKKGEYLPQDEVIYCELDSWIPSTVAPFLTKAGHFPKTYLGVEGERLRTVKLRGQISQGLILPIALLEGKPVAEGEDVSELLGIVKWEAPAEMIHAQAKGTFPSFIPKTDQERIQNLGKSLSTWQTDGSVWEVSEKMDGSSMTVFVSDGVRGVCSRNLELKEDGGNTFWAVAHKQALFDAVECWGGDLALQGELCGPGIQGNPYGLTEPQFFLYNVYDIKTRCYFLPYLRNEFVDSTKVLAVPLIGYRSLEGVGMADLLELADGKSCVGTKPVREGLVFKHRSSEQSFKVISNKWLLKAKN